MFEFIVRLQPPVPEQAPPHPPKVEPPVGVMLSDTAVPDTRFALHVPLVFPALIAQLIPDPVIVPWPVPPPVVTESV